MIDYKEKYEAALQTAKQWIADGCSDVEKIALECVFPELRESEDEKTIKNIRLALLTVEDAFWRTHGLTAKEAISYLEKQQKPESASASSIPSCWEEKQKINTEGDFGRGYDCGYQAGYAVAKNEMKPKVVTATLDSEKQKEQKPEYASASTIMIPSCWEEKKEEHWKPSEEQMAALNKARRFVPYNCDILESLYEQLKKLMEE